MSSNTALCLILGLILVMGFGAGMGIVCCVVQCVGHVRTILKSRKN